MPCGSSEEQDPLCSSKRTEIPGCNNRLLFVMVELENEANYTCATVEGSELASFVYRSPQLHMPTLKLRDSKPPIGTK